MKELLTTLSIVTVLGSTSVAAERVLKNELVINSSAEKAWTAFTSAEELKIWNVKDAVMEMKLLGRYHTHYSGKVGDSGTITNTILSYVPGRMFSFKLGYPDNFMVPDESGKFTPVPEVKAADTLFAVVEFESLGENQVKIVVTLPGYQEGRQWDLVYRFFDIGNDYTLKQLKKYLER